MRKIFPLILISFLMLSSSTAVYTSVLASELVEDSWNAKTPMSQARANLGVVAVEGKIYAIGGYTTINQEWWGPYQHGFCGTNEMYDTALDTWVTLEPMPTSRANFAIVALSGKIYCIGGEVLDEPEAYRVYRIVEVYDIVTDSWSVKKDIPFDGLDIQAHVIAGKIFVISKGQDLFIYDPNTDKWTQKTSMPRPEDIAASAKILDAFSIATDNKIMVYFKYAPYDSAPTLPFIFKGKVMTYDTKTNVWSEEGKKPPNVLAIAGGCITTGIYAPQRVYIFGTNNTLIYNPVNDVWSTSKTMPTYREQFGVAVVDDILYVIGGRGADFDPIIFSETEQYVPNSYVGTSRSGALTAIIGAITIVAVVTIFTGIILLQKRKNVNKKLMT